MCIGCPIVYSGTSCVKSESSCENDKEDDNDE